MKNGQVVAVYNIIDRFMNDADMPSDISYAFFRLRKIIENNIEYQVERQKKFVEKHHGKKTDDNSVVFPSGEEREAFDRDVYEFANSDVELEPFEKIPFKNDGRCKLSIGELIILEAFLEYQ